MGACIGNTCEFLMGNKESGDYASQYSCRNKETNTIGMILYFTLPSGHYCRNMHDDTVEIGKGKFWDDDC
jgi:hypothetical protein